MAERAAGRANLKKNLNLNEQFPLSCPQAAPGPPRRDGAIGQSSIVATLEAKSLVYCAFQVPLRLISCQPAQPRLGTRPGGLGETQAVTTHRPNSSSWVGSRALIVKVMVGGGRQSIRAPAELRLGPGEMNTQACVNEGAGWWSSCRNAKGRTLEPMSGTACVVQP
jgi:hypothetical protein